MTAQRLAPDRRVLPWRSSRDAAARALHDARLPARADMARSGAAAGRAADLPARPASTRRARCAGPSTRSAMLRVQRGLDARALPAAAAAGRAALNPQGLAGVAPDLAFNTAASFTTNTNWQAYVGETTMSYLTQMAGLAYHNFVSAAVGIALAIAFIRGIARRERDTLGNFWVDMTRATLWVLLPFCLVGALLLVSQGVVQNLRPYDTRRQPDSMPRAARVSHTADRPGAGRLAGNHQRVGHQRRRVLQRQQRPPVREPDAALQLPRDVRDLRDLGRPDLHARAT